MGAQFSLLLPHFPGNLIKQNVPKLSNYFLYTPALSAELIAQVYNRSLIPLEYSLQ
jgi:hypothetical protein